MLWICSPSASVAVTIMDSILCVLIFVVDIFCLDFLFPTGIQRGFNIHFQCIRITKYTRCGENWRSESYSVNFPHAWVFPKRKRKGTADKTPAVSHFLPYPRPPRESVPGWRRHTPTRYQAAALPRLSPG